MLQGVTMINLSSPISHIAALRRLLGTALWKEVCSFELIPHLSHAAWCIVLLQEWK